MTDYAVTVVWDLPAEATDNVEGVWSMSSDGRMVTGYHVDAESTTEAIEKALTLIRGLPGGHDPLAVAVEATTPTPHFIIRGMGR
jgi:hypothetical protein